MKRGRIAIGFLAIVLGVVVIASARCGSDHGSPTPGSAALPATHPATRTDPRTLPPGSLAGTIRDDHGAPIARARVCTRFAAPGLSAQLTRDPTCVVTDDHGAYRIGGLSAATYWAFAMAPRYAPSAFVAAGGSEASAILLAPGDNRAGIDIVLATGAVEVTGTVSDISAGPIAHARVWGESLHDRAYVTETDERGAFSLWLAPSKSAVFHAVADGYAIAREQGQAPDTIELLLTPESSLAGVVVDAATGEPREGVLVRASSGELSRFTQVESDLSDASGRFRITRLLPSRFTLEARGETGFGRSEGSVLVGLGQHVDGVTVKLHRAYRITGTIVIAGTKQPCASAWIAIARDASDAVGDGYAKQGDAGSFAIEGVVPGSYHVQVRCAGHYLAGEPAVLTLKDRDLTGLVWEMVGGGSIHGHVRTHGGEPVPGTDVFARSITPLPRGADGAAHTVTTDDGEYTIAGLHAARYTLEASSPAGAPPKDIEVTVATTATAEQDILLDDGGTITGTVVGRRGAPLAHLEVHAVPVKPASTHDPAAATTDRDGAFRIDGVAGGEYRVHAMRGWSNELRKPGSTDDDVQGEPVHVEIGKIANIKLVVEDEVGAIEGSVVDADDKPIGDAWVTAARESEGGRGNAAAQTYWNLDARPVLTSPDGTFRITALAAGAYTVRAFRKGGGDAIAEHIAIGAVARLQIKPTASIEGVVRLPTGPPPDDFTITARAPALGIVRTERLFRSDGRYAVRDLPAGSLDLIVTSRTGRGSLAVTLAAGEHKTGADIALDPLVTLTGTLVELDTRAPIPDLVMFAQPRRASTGAISFGTEVTSNITDANGRFTIEGAPVGAIVLVGLPRATRASWRVGIAAAVAVTASGSVDLGELGVVRPRVKSGDPIGKLGARFVHGDESEWYAERHEVAWIDPKGPAAKTELAVGDIVETIDGIDVTGSNTGRFDPLIEAPPGTTITLGVARKAPIKIILAP